MSEPVSALGGASFVGFCEVEELGPRGMITLRGKLGSEALGAAVKSLTGLGVPQRRAILSEGGKTVAWMSPDELLLILPYGDVDAAIASLSEALKGEHAMAVNVSDARCAFKVTGKGAREALAKLCPVDLSPAAFGPGELRRTRAAQVAAALWMSGEEEFTLVAFRSVAGYVMGLLTAASAPGGEVGVFA